MKFNVPLCEGDSPSLLPPLAPRDKSRFSARARPLAGLLFAAALVSSIATSKAFPEWSAEAESETLELVDLEQPHLVQLQAEGELAEGVGYYGTQLEVHAWATVNEGGDEELDDTGDSGGGEPVEGLEPVVLQLRLSSESIGEEPLLIDLPAYSKKGLEPAHVGTAFVLPCADSQLGNCSDEVQVELVLSRELQEGESVDGEVLFRGLASGPVYGEEASFPEVSLSLSVEPALD